MTVRNLLLNVHKNARTLPDMQEVTCVEVEYIAEVLLC